MSEMRNNDAGRGLPGVRLPRDPVQQEESEKRFSYPAGGCGALGVRARELWSRGTDAPKEEQGGSGPTRGKHCKLSQKCGSLQCFEDRLLKLVYY